MEIIKFLSAGKGLVLMMAVLALVFTGIALIIRKSSMKKYMARLLFPVFFIETSIGFFIV